MDKHAGGNITPGTVSGPGGSRANIGRSLFIKGEVSGSEDLMIEGHVEGRIHLKDHDLIVGEHSKVNAEVHAKNITILGKVTGNMVADEKVTLTDSGHLVGNIRAPRIAVSDGAQFRGNVEMSGMTETGQTQQAPKLVKEKAATVPRAGQSRQETGSRQEH